MTVQSHSYITQGGVRVSRLTEEIASDTALDTILSALDTRRGGLLASSYEYPGRYKRWAIGLVDPPLELATRDRTFILKAHNERGKSLLPYIAQSLCHHPQLAEVALQGDRITGSIEKTSQLFSEEQRSQQPSVFTLIRLLSELFASPEDEHLGLYGAFGYDLVFQFESITQHRTRPDDQRDLVLYLPDELTIVDYYLQCAYRVQYEFATPFGNTQGLPRTGETIDYRGQPYSIAQVETRHGASLQEYEYTHLVETAFEYFRRGDLFEVVPSQSFFQVCEESPTKLFQNLQQINPSPYGFIFNLGGEYLIGASPEMFVRVEGRCVETCPISGTIGRGEDAISDAAQIRQLLNSHKDEAELTMCTDVDRNDKSRICEPGSVKVIGRRQIELYSHLIHTVDHVEGILRPEFDALDAFLTHTWAVTVTGAPKRSAIQFIEQHERSVRRWYGGAVGYFAFNGNLNTGLILRTIRLQNSLAEVRVGATVLFDSVPEAEERETLTKAAALFQTLHQAKQPAFAVPTGFKSDRPSLPKRVLLIDYEDSFVHTLANYLRQAGAVVTTLRHGFDESLLDPKALDLVVLSPGPGRPQDFGVPATVHTCISRGLPIFGVCLGLQGIVEAFGGQLGVLDYPQHGKTSRIFASIPNSSLLANLPVSFEVGRYHSLFAIPEQLPPELQVTAVSEDDVIMAIEHISLPIAAVQFHPESIMTLAGNIGLSIIKNVMQSYAKTDGTIPISLSSTRDLGLGKG